MFSSRRRSSVPLHQPACSCSVSCGDSTCSDYPSQNCATFPPASPLNFQIGRRSSLGTLPCNSAPVAPLRNIKPVDRSELSKLLELAHRSSPPPSVAPVSPASKPRKSHPLTLIRDSNGSSSPHRNVLIVRDATPPPSSARASSSPLKRRNSRHSRTAEPAFFPQSAATPPPPPALLTSRPPPPSVAFASPCPPAHPTQSAGCVQCQRDRAPCDLGSPCIQCQYFGRQCEYS